MANPQVSRKSADILLKWTASALRGALFARYDLGLPDIVRELPTELAVLEVRSEALDRVFVLADERALHLEFQTEKRANDLERFHAYDTGLYSLHKRKVVTVVFYGPGITSAPHELDGGSFVYRVHTIFLGTQQGEEVLARLRATRERGEVFGPEERADLILLSQMAQQRPLAEVLRDAVRLAPALPEEERLTTLGAMIGIAYNRLDEGVARALLQEPEMMNVLEELVERGYEQGLAEGKAEGLAEGQLQGKAEGLAEGQLQGEVKGKRESVRGLILVRFGVVPPALEEQVARADAAALDALFGRAAVAHHVAEIG